MTSVTSLLEVKILFEVPEDRELGLQILENKFPNKLDITADIGETGTFEVILPEPDIVLHSKKNGSGYVDTEEKIRAICEGIKKQLRAKFPKSNVVTKKLLKKLDQGHASPKLEAKPETKRQAKAETKLETIPELKTTMAPEVKEPPLRDLTTPPEVAKKTDALVVTKTTNDLEATTTRT